tara:strand:+ start:5721 stop:6278 length:558 start_codon:yes stop_codon:yes gene_type:complete
MQRNIILLTVLIVFNLGFWFIKSFYFNSKPDIILNLENEQNIVNEKYITAQILSQSLDMVYKLFEENLAIEISDERNESASLPFIKSLTDILNNLEIKILGLKPKPIEKDGIYTIIPYEIEIKCNYETFGKLINELEKNDRLIIIDEFKLNNGLERISSSSTPDELSNQNIEMLISTITLNKSRG